MATDLHRHDEYSAFDGYGSPLQAARAAKELGYTSLSITNHGTTSGLVKHYKACKQVGLNCILGIEAYFIPKLKEGVRENYHLCIYAKTLKGYENMNRLATRGEEQKYYKPLITFKDLEEFREDLIVSSACIGGYLSQKIIDGKNDLALKAAKKFKDIFGEDFYIEIQPYKVSEKGLQESVNIELIKIAKKLGIKCILTSDSHYTKKEELNTYLKMHEIGKSKFDVLETYGEHYMPSIKEMISRCKKMHEKDLKKLGYNPKEFILGMVKNIEEVEGKIEQNILDGLTLKLPKVCENADEVLKKEVIKGLKKHGRSKDKEYVKRCKYELDVMKEIGVADYFLIVQDYINYAKKKGIPVGAGRGSVCNSQVAFETGITEVDSIRFGLAFERFLRHGKYKLPDIDTDFATNRRQEVIDYLIDKYGKSSAQVASYGLYKVDNLVNDLSNVCGLDDVFEKKELKALLKDMVNKDGEVVYPDVDDEDKEIAEKAQAIDYYNEEYDNICVHFQRLYGKIRQMGTHAAGVAIVDGDILKYCAITIKKEKNGHARRYTCYDLADLGEVHVEKFDMLGLGTMEELGELREQTGGTGVTEEMFTDKKIWGRFKKGLTEGIFQFDNKTPRGILEKINADCFEDLIATNSMNRPAPLAAKMPDLYAHNKKHQEDASKNKWYKYTSETYGVVVYQEQLQKLVIDIGGFTFDEADRLLKLIKGDTATQGDKKQVAKEKEDMLAKFIKNAQKKGWTKEEARDTFKALMSYLFNKGHATGYSLISLEEMYYCVYYPCKFWCSKLNKEGDEIKRYKYKRVAAKEGIVIFFPSVNASARNSVEIIDGEEIIREGMQDIKGVGDKAAEYIEKEREKNGDYKDIEDFMKRCKVKGSPVNKRVIENLESAGALVFNETVRKRRTIKYLSTLIG